MAKRLTKSTKLAYNILQSLAIVVFVVAFPFVLIHFSEQTANKGQVESAATSNGTITPAEKRPVLSSKPPISPSPTIVTQKLLTCGHTNITLGKRCGVSAYRSVSFTCADGSYHTLSNTQNTCIPYDAWKNSADRTCAVKMACLKLTGTPEPNALKPNTVYHPMQSSITPSLHPATPNDK